MTLRPVQVLLNQQHQRHTAAKPEVVLLGIILSSPVPDSDSTLTQ